MLYADLEDVWQAFCDLHESRLSGFGPTAIPVSEILSWLDLQGIQSREMRLEYFELIRVMDNTWLRWATEKAAQANDKPKSKNTNE